jgi:hypothetical protein
MIFFLLQTTTQDPTFRWALIALAVATIFYATVIRPAMKKKKDPLEYRPIAGSLTKERTVERQMQNLLVELSEMTRQITAQLDTRSQKLQLLIHDADERIAALKQLENQANTPRSELVWPAPTQPVIRETPPPEPVDEQHQRVYTLADRGKTAGEIARELNQPRGEVELILALRPKAVAGNAER